MLQFRYLPRKEKLFGYCYLAVSDWFESARALQSWYDGLPSDERREKFLKIAPHYLALVKKGDWHVDIPDANVIIDYLTDTLKFVAIIALIEALSDETHIDFYAYLMRRTTKDEFPLTRDQITEKYESYNEEYSANRRCISFFRRLPAQRQQELAGLLQLTDPDVSIETFVKFLYQVRSDFVHNAAYAHEISKFQTLSRFKGKPVISGVSIADAMKFFEEGLIAWCQH